MKQWHNLILAAGFALGLVIPLIGSLGHVSPNRTINEYRHLAKFPRLRYDPDVWDFYFNNVETYFEDNFSLRESLIAFGLASKRLWFPAELGPNVLLGRDGWLYLKRDRKADLVDDCLGLAKISESELKDAQSRLESQRDWLAARGIKYLFVIAPDKAAIYPEHLPVWLKAAATNRTDQYVEYMHLHSTVDVLDLRPVLRQAREKIPVYYFTDPHWNVPGALVATETILAELARQMPGLAPLDQKALALQWVPGTGGDLARQAAEPDLVESNRYVLLPTPNLPKLEFSVAETNAVGLAQILDLPVPEFNTITTTNLRGTGRVVLFGDSFSVDLQPFLAYDFGKVVGYRKPFDKRSVNEVRPVVVIDEVVERNLCLEQ